MESITLSHGTKRSLTSLRLGPYPRLAALIFNVPRNTWLGRVNPEEITGKYRVATSFLLVL